MEQTTVWPSCASFRRVSITFSAWNASKPGNKQLLTNDYRHTELSRNFWITWLLKSRRRRSKVTQNEGGTKEKFLDTSSSWLAWLRTSSLCSIHTASFYRRCAFFIVVTRGLHILVLFPVWGALLQGSCGFWHIQLDLVTNTRTNTYDWLPGS